MSTDHARALFSGVMALAPDGDPNAYGNVHWSYVSKKDGKTYWSGRACKTAEEMVEAVIFANRSPQTKDVYFALSTQRLAESRTINGKAVLTPVRSQQNVAHLRSLYVDIDVKDGAYADQREALVALAQFVRDAGMPSPTALVSSGSGGLHVYWALDKPLTLAEWQPLANSLAEATRRHKLMCDTACTVDGARILRVPGTLNRKREPNTIVELLTGRVYPPVPVATVREALADYLPSNVTPLMPLMAKAGLDLSVNDDLSAGVQMSRPVVLSDVAAAGCGFIAEALSTGGAAYPYPLWNLTTLIATFTDEGSAAAHDMAKGHPQYDAVQTEAQFQQKLQERSRKNLGWPSCQTIQNAGCGHCATCPHLALGKSPLNLGVSSQPRPQPGAQDDLPPKYMRDANGAVRMAVTLDTGATDWELIIPDPILDGHLDMTTEPATLIFTTINPFTKQPRTVRATTDIINSTSPNDLLKRLGAQAFMVPAHRGNALKDFLMSYTRRLQELSGRVLEGRPFGWEWKDGKPISFTYDGTAYGVGGSKTKAVHPSRMMAYIYSPHGDLAIWKDAVNSLLCLNRPDLELMLATAFAAPLLNFTGEDGAIVSAMSIDSGAGKSTALKLALSVWASPRAYSGNDDTPGTVRDKIATLRNIPAYWDDMRPGAKPEQLIDFVLSISSGKGKARLNRDGTPRAVPTYETMLVTTSNVSLFEMASRYTGGDVAPSYRVFEFTPPVNAKIPPTGNETALLCSHHYGLAGRIYAEYLGANGPAVQEMTRKTLGTLKMRFDFKSAERFWFATAASIIVGAQIAKNLDLVQFNMPALLKFVTDKIGVLRHRIGNSTQNLAQEGNVDEVLQRYLDYVGPTATLVTRIVCDPRMRGQPEKQDHLGDRSTISRDAILIHRGAEDGRVMMSKRDFETWLYKTGYQADAVLRALERRWGMISMRATLGAGTEYAKPMRISVYFVDLNTPPPADGT